jgi:hypothetical protein
MLKKMHIRLTTCIKEPLNSLASRKFDQLRKHNPLNLRFKENTNTLKQLRNL